MHLAVLGTGDVGKTLAAGLARHGHHVIVGTRDPNAMKWHADHDGIDVASSAQAAAVAEAAILCTSWEGVGPVLEAAAKGLSGKLLIDVTNPLRFADHGPPELAVSGTDSAGETVQRMAPEARVVKCWNIVGHPYMIDPDLPGTPTMFIAGNDDAAKDQVRSLLAEVGWPDVVDLGGIDASRYLEALAMVWILTYFATGSGAHAFTLLRQPEISKRTV